MLNNLDKILRSRYQFINNNTMKYISIE